MTHSDNDRRITEEVSPMTEQHRSTQVTRWVAWHAAELVALGVPVVLAITVSAWFWVVAVVAGAGWSGHEIRQQRRRQSLHTAKTSQLTNTTRTEGAAGQPTSAAPRDA